MCNKVEARIECYHCGYPYSEARYPDTEPPMACDTDPSYLAVYGYKLDDVMLRDTLKHIRVREE